MNNIFLVGLMGVGKSTIGEELAANLGLKFMDTDAEIERMQKMSIQEIFQLYGESRFREMEHEFLLKLEAENSVISTGGGMACFHNNLPLMKELGSVVYLMMDNETLAKRLWVKRKSRPLISHSKSIEDLVRILAEQREKREVYYLGSDHVLDVSNKASCEIVSELKLLIKKLN